MKQDLSTISLTKNKIVITEVNNDVNATKLRNTQIIEKMSKYKPKKQTDSFKNNGKEDNSPKSSAYSSTTQKTSLLQDY